MSCGLVRLGVVVLVAFAGGVVVVGRGVLGLYVD